MAYADQQMSGSKVTALVIVALIHVLVGYALVTGLAYEAAKQVIKKVTTVDIKEEEAKGATPKGQSGWAARIQSNYPTRAVREEREGRVGVRVTIGPDGRVTACSVSSSSGSPDLDEAACEGMSRYARFNPAQDTAGNPISDSYSTAIVYKLD